MRYATLLIALFLLTALAALAQPEDSGEPWLMVRAVTQDGAVHPAMPSVRLARVVGTTRVPVESRTLVPMAPLVLVLGLTPGPHELTVSLPSLGLASEPIPLTIAAGANAYDWRLPRLVPVGGAFESGIAPATVLAYVAPRASALQPCDVAVTADGHFQLGAGLPVGAYDLLLLSTAGWAFQPLVVTAETEAVAVTVALQPGCTIAGQVTDARTGASLPAASVTLRGYRLAGGATGVSRIPVTLDAQGAFTSLVLPPGSWRATAYAPGYTSLYATYTCKAGETTTAALKLARP